MQFAEYYMAVNALIENPDLKLVILDRTLLSNMFNTITVRGRSSVN
jgi:hypothetical protein